jgi:hypothetical protein
VEVASDSLSTAEIDSLTARKNRFHEDTLIRIEKLERSLPNRRLDSLRLP